jgi:hypothetical protein
MAKETGIVSSVTVDDSGGTARDISNDITNWAVSTPRAVQDVTGLNKSAMERLLLLADMSWTLNFIFNDAGAPSSHDCFKTVPSSSVARTVTLAQSGQTLPGECFFTDYALTRAASGELTGTAPGVLQNGTVPTWA